ncbi:hypothetical protein [Secundilactobacillus kimchicus]|nr:hypothetical protein [Secundilactobacillus kimchicus]
MSIKPCAADASTKKEGNPVNPKATTNWRSLLLAINEFSMTAQPAIDDPS